MAKLGIGVRCEKDCKKINVKKEKHIENKKKKKVLVLEEKDFNQTYLERKDSCLRKRRSERETGREGVKHLRQDIY